MKVTIIIVLSALLTVTLAKPLDNAKTLEDIEAVVSAVKEQQVGRASNQGEYSS